MSTRPSLRERRKALTRAAIQQQALRLFLAKGYDSTTVEEISAAAGVSHMTFFRYFPSKEDVVLADEYDVLIFERIRERPAEEPALDKIRHAFQQGLARVYAANRDVLLVRTRLILDTAALRAGLWRQQRATERLIATALAAATDTGSDGSDMRTRVVASAALAAITTAVEMWAEGAGAGELPDLIDQALTLLGSELSSAHE